MNRITYIILFAFCFSLSANAKTTSLKESFKNKFLIGVALSDRIITSENEKIHQSIAFQYNSIVAENCMKSESIQPKEGTFDFVQSDRFVEFGAANGMYIIGHTLVWHSQTPDWLFIDDNGNDVSRDVLIKRMRTHIHTLVGRYKGRVKGWDVVNEAILGDGTYRKSKFYNIIGEDFIELAFQFAHEADPDAELYYNDYGMDNPKKCDGVVKMVEKLKSKGIRIDGIGMQAHYNLNFSKERFENSVKAFAATGLKVMITELDVSVLPFPSKNNTADVNKNYEYQKKLNPYTKGLPKEVEKKQTQIYQDLFKVLLKHQKSVTRVTFWGLNDANSWKNNWPVKGRTDYPLLFDRNNQPKTVFDAVVELVE